MDFVVAVFVPAAAGFVVALALPRVRRFRRNRRVRRRLVAMVAVVSAIAASFAGGEPTGLGGVDQALLAATGALGALAGATARSWNVSLACAGALAAVVAGSHVEGLAAGAYGVSLGRVSTRRGGPVIKACLGAAVAQVVLRLDWSAFTGSSALAGAVVMGFLAATSLQGLRVRNRRRVLAGAGAVAGLAVVAAGMMGATGLSVRGDVDDAVGLALEGLDLARSGDQSGAGARFDEAARLFDRAHDRLASWVTRPGRLVPGVAQQAETLEVLSAVGAELASTAASTTRAADPDAARPVDGRVDLAVVRALEAPLSEALAALREARERAAPLDSPWLLPAVDHALDTFEARIGEAISDSEHALEAVRVAPGLLGSDGLRRYLVLFTTPAEMRGNGGFIGNWAELIADGGRIEMTRFGRIHELNDAAPPEGPHLEHPADYLARYGRFDVERFWQDFTLSPDFPSVAQVAESAYPQSGGREIDGVISVDPYALASLMELTGPVELEGLPAPLEAENAAEFLLFEQYRLFPEKAERVDFLETVARTVFDQLLEGDLPGPATIASTLGPVIGEDRLKMHSAHPEEQAYFEEVGFADAFPEVRGDFVALVTQNSGHTKTDTFLHRSLRYSTTIDPATGEVEASARIVLRNEAPAPGLPGSVLGGSKAPPGDNLMYLSFYTPLGLEGATAEGEPLLMESEVELGRHVYSSFVQVPLGSQVTLELRLVGRVDLGGDGRYVLDVAHQPLVNPDKVSVAVSLRDTADPFLRETLTLERDTSLEAPLPR